MIKRILVDDDEPTIRDLVADALRESGYRVSTAPNGAEALRSMRRNTPHAVVLDVMMPHLDAYGFVELMRLNARFSSIPILLITAAYGAYEVAERLGASAGLTKPFELDDLVEIAGRLVGQQPRQLDGADGTAKVLLPLAAEALVDGRSAAQLPTPDAAAEA